MKLIFLFLLTSCSLTEVVPPEPKVECPHVLYWNQERQKLEVEITSELPSVELCWSTDGQIEHCTIIQANYYECFSMSLPDDETVITIYSEVTCQYTF
jgi:hypothetical protein